MHDRLRSEHTCAGEGLTGTKLGCGEGGCGACTVMVSSWEGGSILHRAVNACLCPLYAVEGMHGVTVEGGLPGPCFAAVAHSARLGLPLAGDVPLVRI